MKEPPIEDDDTFDSKPPPGPTRHETWKAWAEAGGVEELLGVLRSRPLGYFNVPELLRMLMRACQVRARSDPRGFAEFLFSEMVALNGLLLLRAQLQIGARIAACGERMGQPGIVELSPDITERLLPALAEMQRGLGEVLATQAATARMWTLADAKRAANGESTGAGPTVPLRSRTSAAPEAGRKGRHVSNGKDRATMNGKAAGATNGRAVAPTNGVGAGPGGRRRHD